jgi:Zn-dependent protease
MFTKKEIINIVIISFILGFSLSLVTNLETFTSMFISSLLVILINMVTKKIVAERYDTKIEHHIWEIQKYGFRPLYKFAKPIPLGAILPILVTILSAGYITWMNGFYFTATPEIYKSSKRRGFYPYSASSEFHEGLIATWGVVLNLIFGIAGILIGFPVFAKLNFLYAFFNIIPLGKLDGNKILFGEKGLWYVIAIVSSISAILALMFL